LECEANQYHKWMEKQVKDPDTNKNMGGVIGELNVYKKALRSLLNKVNRVTSAHRHGLPFRKGSLDELSNRQIEVEGQIKLLDGG